MAYEGFEQSEQSARGLIGAGANKMVHRSKLDRLRDMKRGLESKLEEVNKAIKLLEDNPQLTEIIDALEKVGV